MSRVTCHMSRVTCVKKKLKKWTKLWSLSVEGLLSTGPTPSSFYHARACPRTTSAHLKCKHRILNYRSCKQGQRDRQTNLPQLHIILVNLDIIWVYMRKARKGIHMRMNPALGAMKLAHVRGARG